MSHLSHQFLSLELRVESAPGSGSRFWFDLDVAHDQPRAACPGPANRCGCWQADDNLVAGELLERTVGALEAADCVGSGSEAVARVQRRWPKAVATTWC